ncbi:hypothetical protein [Haliangium sp. UPWRP_2]|uniref:hypothetical protein n=1 Tax=Haliangium sp. UPWRP_2 TaxID=1931276 RepID=UPI0013048CED|nr:hypothetical protein [Haliangium sp. UPWRP_2]
MSYAAGVERDFPEALSEPADQARRPDAGASQSSARVERDRREAGRGVVGHAG